MDTLTSSRNWLPALSGLKPGRITVMLAPHAARALLLEGAARLALHNTVRVLDGGNQFNAYNVARSIRRYTADLEPTLARIHLARAFTCYQVETLVSGAAMQVEATPGHLHSGYAFHLQRRECVAGRAQTSAGAYSPGAAGDCAPIGVW